MILIFAKNSQRFLIIKLFPRCKIHRRVTINFILPNFESFKKSFKKNKIEQNYILVQIPRCKINHRVPIPWCFTHHRWADFLFIISVNLQQKWNRPRVPLRGPGGALWWRKKTNNQKSRDTVPIIRIRIHKRALIKAAYYIIVK